MLGALKGEEEVDGEVMVDDEVDWMGVEERGWGSLKTGEMEEDSLMGEMGGGLVEWTVPIRDAMLKADFLLFFCFSGYYFNVK